MFDKVKALSQNFPAYIRRYVWPLPKFRREIVITIDGLYKHGGLTDRFRHILSVYSYCKKYDMRFRLFYVSPIPLQQLLIPHKYDWTIKESKVSYSYFDSEEVHLWVRCYQDEKRFSEINIQLNNSVHQGVLDKIRESNKRKQYHIYGNCYFAKGHFHELFNELFLVSPYLEARIQQCALNFPYEAVTLRFQQLLGDFEEGDFEVLPDKEKDDPDNVMHAKNRTFI